jgi:endonuclease/exonuclease/phosphatase family metal-dependent hydrolase
LATTRIDHIFIDKSIAPLAIYTPDNALARVASDHLPLVMDINLSLTNNP